MNEAPGYRRRHALVVGIDDYTGTGFPSLGYAVADARAVARILIERYGFEQEDVKLLLDGDEALGQSDYSASSIVNAQKTLPERMPSHRYRPAGPSSVAQRF